MLAHSCDRFYVIIKSNLLSVNDLKFLSIDLDHNSKEYISNLKLYCKKIVPFTCFYKEQISSYNCTAHNILMNEISLILPNFPKAREEKRSIISSIITGFIGLA